MDVIKYLNQRAMRFCSSATTVKVNYQNQEENKVNHQCHAVNCSVIVPPRLLMCRPHWFMLTTKLRQSVLKSYRPGQEQDKRPSPEYMLAYASAINFVAEKEGHEKPFLMPHEMPNEN